MSWIKMTCGLENDPAVIALSASLELDSDAILGKLYRLWTWADQHLEDGNAPGVTDSWVDRYMGVTGFADALAQVGWMRCNCAGIAIPGFDKHMGQSAKRRAVTARRVAKHRRNDASVTREEKSRVKNKDSCASAFATFWKAYPKKRSKGAAEKVWKREKCHRILEAILSALEKVKRSHDWTKDGGQFIPYPATWLNAKGWKDEAVVESAPPVRPDDKAEKIARWREMLLSPDHGQREHAAAALKAMGLET